ncbi:MAG: glycosyltransferase family 9 protein [Bdellovibrio sp.]
MKIVLIRLDKIGDLVATLPVDQIPELQNHTIKWVIAEGLGFLAKNANPPRDLTEICLQDRQKGQNQLAAFLKAEKPDLAIVFYGPWWVSKTLWSEGVARRFGRRSQWHSYVFLNEGLRQSRSASEKHESTYNLELVLKALNAPQAPDRLAPTLELSTKPLRHLFERFGFTNGHYYVVHPGMAGSALNWPSSRYIELIEELKLEKEVLLTGTSMDEPYLAPLKSHFSGDARVQSLQAQLTLEELLFVLKFSAGVVAPSTGVVHLAASLGVKTVGLYSPVQAHHPQRWGPRGPHVHVLVPKQVSENCMNEITVEQVLACLK